MNFDPTSTEGQALIGGVIRAVLSAAGGAGILSQTQLGQVAGAAAVLITVIWSLYQKHQTATTTVSHDTLTKAVVAASQSTPAAANDIITAAKAGQL